MDIFSYRIDPRQNLVRALGANSGSDTHINNEKYQSSTNNIYGVYEQRNYIVARGRQKDFWDFEGDGNVATSRNCCQDVSRCLHCPCARC